MAILGGSFILGIGGIPVGVSLFVFPRLICQPPPQIMSGLLFLWDFPTWWVLSNLSLSSHVTHVCGDACVSTTSPSLLYTLMSFLPSIHECTTARPSRVIQNEVKVPLSCSMTGNVRSNSTDSFLSSWKRDNIFRTDKSIAAVGVATQFLK